MVGLIERRNKRDFPLSISRNIYRKNLTFYHGKTICFDFRSMFYRFQPLPVFLILREDFFFFVQRRVLRRQRRFTARRQDAPEYCGQKKYFLYVLPAFYAFPGFPNIHSQPPLLSCCVCVSSLISVFRFLCPAHAFFFTGGSYLIFVVPVSIIHPSPPPRQRDVQCTPYANKIPS